MFGSHRSRISETFQGFGKEIAFFSSLAAPASCSRYLVYCAVEPLPFYKSHRWCLSSLFRMLYIHSYVSTPSLVSLRACELSLHTYLLSASSSTTACLHVALWQASLLTAPTVTLRKKSNKSYVTVQSNYYRCMYIHPFFSYAVCRT